MALDLFPNELLLMILNGVAWSDRPASTRAAIAIGGVCRRWRGLRHAIDLNCTWAGLTHLKECRKMRMDDLWSMVKAYRLVSLDVGTLHYNQYGPVTVATPMLHEPTVWRSITGLNVNVEGITLPALNKLAAKTPMVQTVSLRSTINPGTYVDALRQWRCLRTIHVFSDYRMVSSLIQDLVTAGPRSLRWIDIKRLSVAEADLIALLQAFPLLVRFDVTPTERYTECMAVIIERWAPNLQVLNVNPRWMELSSLRRLVSWEGLDLICITGLVVYTMNLWEEAKAASPDTDRAALRQLFINVE
jgi:hypothetical protein